MNAIFKHLKGDKGIWGVVLLLSLFSLLAVFSSTSTLAFKYQEGNVEYYFFKHFILLGFGLILMFFAHKVPYTYYSRLSQIGLYIAVPLLFVTLILGTNINEASRWLTLPGINLSFQTSDFAKLTLIMYVSRMLSKKRNVIKDFDDAFLPIIAPIIAVCLLIVPANLSTAALLFSTCLILMFIGRIRMRHLGVAVGMAFVGFALFVLLALFTSYNSRIETWKSRIESFSGKNGENYQAEQSKIAIANGGLIRIAPGKSTQKNFLPQPYSDFIYAIIIEEYGMLGGLIVLGLYLYFLYKSIKIFILSPEAYGALLAVGLAISLVIQALMNMAVTVNLLPVTGLPLPLVSMGGSALWFNSIAIGIILSVSKAVQEYHEKVQRGEITPAEQIELLT